MQFVNVAETDLERMIETLESAVNVCYNVDYNSEDSEKSAPYATGYSRAAMQQIIEDLNRLKSQAN